MIKNFILGLIIFITIFLVGLLRGDLGLTVNIAGGVGIFSIIGGAFLKGAFGSRNGAVATTQNMDMYNLKNRWSKVIISIGIPNLIGSLVLYKVLFA